MGVQTSQQTNSIQSKLKPHQEVDDPIFGSVQILRSTEPPYDYIMKYKRKFYNRDLTYDSIFQHFKKLEAIHHKPLSKIHHVMKDQQTYACTKTPTISCYVSYYNFTLKKAAERKKQLNGSFSEADMWFMLSTLIQLAKQLQQSGISLGQYSTDRIYLAPDGSLKLYLLNVVPDNQHNPYYQILADPEQLYNYLLSPEQLFNLSKDQYEIKFDIYKSDLFIIGLVILQMASLKPSNKYYNYNTKSISRIKLKQELLKLRQNYSIEFSNLVEKILQDNPDNRPSFDSVSQYIRRLQTTMNVIRQSKGIKLTQQQSVAQKRKKAIESRRQQLEEEESIQSGTTSLLTTKPPSVHSDFGRGGTATRKISLLQTDGNQSSAKTFSIKSRNITPMRKNPQKINTLYSTSKASFLDLPIRIPKRRFQ